MTRPSIARHDTPAVSIVAVFAGDVITFHRNVPTVKHRTSRGTGHGRALRDALSDVAMRQTEQRDVTLCGNAGAVADTNAPKGYRLAPLRDGYRVASRPVVIGRSRDEISIHDARKCDAETSATIRDIIAENKRKELLDTD